jgi:hypothetical protein
MARVIRYSELLKRGTGFFIKTLQEGDFIIVSNSKVSNNSFVIIKAKDFVNILMKAGMIVEGANVESSLNDIKAAVSAKYRRMREQRLS